MWNGPDHDVIRRLLDGDEIKSVRCNLSPEVEKKVRKAIDDGDQNLAMEIMREAGALVPPTGFEDGQCSLGFRPPVAV
jgi:hypothetical protein